MTTRLSKNLLNSTTNQFLLPAGCILDFAGTVAPTGFLLCDGSAVNRTTYADLFAVIGTTWGSGNGSTTFNLPDFRRRVAVGSGGSSSGTLGNATGSTGGAETVTLSSSEIPSHSHSVNLTSDGQSTTHYHDWDPYGVDATFNSGGAGNYRIHYSADGDGANITTAANSNDHTHGVNGSTGSVGSSGSHNNLPPSAVVTKVIKT